MRTDRRMYVTKLIVALRTRLKRKHFNCLNISEFQALDNAPVKDTYVLRFGRPALAGGMLHLPVRVSMHK
jgi:hypothetical protein